MAAEPRQNMTPSKFNRLLDQAVEEGARHYFSACRKRVDPFVRHHFQYPGVIKTNGHAWGWDLIRAPFNLFWAPVYLLLMLMAWSFHRIGWHPIASRLNRLPAGVDTSVQIYLAKSASKELLQRPVMEGDIDGLRHSIHKALNGLLGDDILDDSMGLLLSKQIDTLIDQSLSHYGVGRTASADIANSLLSMLIGAFAFQKYTPGGFALGLYGASIMAKWLAIEEFWAGSWLGGFYYSVIYIAPSVPIMLLSLTMTLLVLALLGCFSGLIIDPIQSRFKLHQWRLNRLINHLEKDFKKKSDSSFRPKEPYLARVLDLLDIARSHLT